ncbi:MAG: hypothetical protein K6F00_03965 [Lachnospiraceae bacterium]|nr:hypothetical protein [Lachnospiraceae bacterium]
MKFKKIWAAILSSAMIASAGVSAFTATVYAEDYEDYDSEEKTEDYEDESAGTEANEAEEVENKVKTTEISVRDIQSELDKNGKYIFKSGKTYILDHTLYISSNQTIKAKGATIKCAAGAVRNYGTKKNYNSASNIKIIGGKWISTSKTGYDKSSFQFVHAKNITLKNMTIKNTNYSGHSIELIACKNVKVTGCKITPLGKAKSGSVEEQIQIDMASPSTAPTIESKLQNGATCQNIKIKNTTVTGCRAVCANISMVDGDSYKKKFHRNVVIDNCKFTGKVAEGLALWNVIGINVKNSTVISNASKTAESHHSDGLCIQMFGTAPSDMSSKTINLTGNTIKGGEDGFRIWSQSSSKFGHLYMKNNKCYSKNGSSHALVASTAVCTRITDSNNGKYGW